MKRMDMLRIMRAETRNRIDTYELDHLLSVMEEAGMLPPSMYDLESERLYETEELLPKGRHYQYWEPEK